MDGPQVWTFDTGGVRIVSDVVDSRFTWRAFDRVLEGQSALGLASGAVYFAINGEHYGPAGQRGSVTSNLALTPTELQGRYAVADINADQDLMRYVAELQMAPASLPLAAAQD